MRAQAEKVLLSGMIAAVFLAGCATADVGANGAGGDSDSDADSDSDGDAGMDAGPDTDTDTDTDTGTCASPVYSETWAAGADGWTAEGNWALDSSTVWSGDQYYLFSYLPTLSDYSRSLTSPVFDLTGCASATLAFQFELSEDDSYEYSEAMAAECAGDGSTWVPVYTRTEGDGSYGPAGVSVPMDASCLTATAQVRFRAYGSYSWGINHWAVDDVTVGL